MNDTDNTQPEQQPESISRRSFLTGAGSGIAATGLVGCGTTGRGAQPAATAAATAPYDSLRDYIGALEAHGMVRRFERVDQDAYEGTAIMYRLVDRFGRMRTPVVVFDEVRIGGRWMRGPVIANHLRHIDCEALLFGLAPVPYDDVATYRVARVHVDRMLADNDGQYPVITPVEISRDTAPCKEVVVDGDDIDLTSLPFFRNNPGDSGRFINTATVLTSDPDMGLNLGTYRCEIKGPRLISVGTGEGQRGFRMLMAAKERGETSAPISLVLGQDPMIWLVSGARIPAPQGRKPVDELGTAGGLRGRAVEIVAADTNELPVPAHAEMIIEGVVTFDEFLPNGPYCESPGYVGAVYEKSFHMDVTRITHRRDPWFVNDFTGVTKPLIEAPSAALTVAGLRRFVPEIVDYRWVDSVTFFSMRKSEPGQALKLGKQLAKLIPIFKIVVMVDEDVDLMNPADLFLAFSTRWQAHPASDIMRDMPTMPLEPSAPTRGTTSKIVIDATRQWPEEGGPAVYPELSRALLAAHAPDIFARVDEKWGRTIVAP